MRLVSKKQWRSLLTIEREQQGHSSGTSNTNDGHSKVRDA